MKHLRVIRVYYIVKMLTINYSYFFRDYMIIYYSHNGIELFIVVGFPNILFSQTPMTYNIYLKYPWGS